MSLDDLLKSYKFQKNVNLANRLTRRHRKETGFSCWMDQYQDIKINLPVVGEKGSILSDYDENENPQDPGTGYREDDGSQTIIDFHTHPPNQHDVKWFRITPSLSDLNALLQKMEKNLQTAQLFQYQTWINPIGMITSPSMSDWSLFQIKASEAIRVQFDADTLFAQAILTMYKSAFPHHAKNSTGTIPRMVRTINGQTPPVVWLTEHLGLPLFLTTTQKRYERFLQTAEVQWKLIDPSSLPETLDFEINIQNVT